MTVSNNFSDVIISEADSERVSIVCFILSFVENEDLGQIPLQLHIFECNSILSTTSLGQKA